MSTGHKFVLMQVLLMGAVVLGPRLDLLVFHFPLGINFFGATLIFSGGLILLPSFVALGRSLTPNPVPKADAVLVTTGMYRFIRHPMYLAVLLSALGLGLWTSSEVSLVFTVVLFFFFQKKATYEEELLLRKFGDAYEHYRKKTGKFFPWIF